MTEEMSAKRIYEAPIMIELGELARGFGQGDQCSPGTNASSPGANACTDGTVPDCPQHPKCCQAGATEFGAGPGSSGGSGFETGSSSSDDSGSGEGSGFSVP